MKKRILMIVCVFLLIALSLPAEAEPEAVRLPVVMYHHISRDRSQWNDYVVSPEEFESDLNYLSAHGWHSIGVRDLLAWYDGEFEMPEKPFMITFDDGFESTLAYAEPLLEEYGFCGVVAVIGSVCEKFSQCDEHDPEFSNLSWEDAAALAERGVIEVQCHTWDMHATWPRCGCQINRDESCEAYRAALTEDLKLFLRKSGEHGVDLVPSIAYPFGAFSPETEEIVLSEGFRVSFTCRERINTLRPGEREPLRLGRYNRPHGPGSERFFRTWEEAAKPEGTESVPSGFSHKNPRMSTASLSSRAISRFAMSFDTSSAAWYSFR